MSTKQKNRIVDIQLIILCYAPLRGGGTSISMYVLLSEDRDISSEEVSRIIRERAEELSCEVSIMGGSSDSMSMFTGDPISVSVQGRELDAIRDTKPIGRAGKPFGYR